MDETLAVDLEELTIGDLKALKAAFKEAGMSWAEARAALEA